MAGRGGTDGVGRMGETRGVCSFRPGALCGMRARRALGMRLAVPVLLVDSS